MPLLLETRSANLSDKEAFKALLGTAPGGTEALDKLYGKYDFEDLVERHCYTVVAYDTETPSQLRGMLTLTDSPADQSDPRTYLDWVSHYCGMGGMPASKTLFLRFMVAEEKHEKDVTAALVESVFDALPDLETLLYQFASKEKEPLPGGCKGLKDHFGELKKLPETTAPKNPEYEGYRVFTCYRTSVLPKLSVRGACVEDYDDLMPVFNNQSDVLSAMYGDFFLAHIIEAQDEQNKAIVGVSRSKAQGFMALTSSVDLAILHKCFALEQFPDLTRTDDKGKEVGNALAITLYCLDHAYASRGRDFLPFAFEQFPATDYLLLTLPSTCTPPPLLSSFTLVRPKPASTLSHVLYLLHRDTLLATSHLRVCRYMSSMNYSTAKLYEELPEDDREKVDELIKEVHRDEALDFTGPQGGAPMSGFVAMVGTQVVAVLILQAMAKNDMERLQVTFAVEGSLCYPSLLHVRDVGLVRVLLANPLVMSHAPLLLRETMRIARKKALLYETVLGDDVPPSVKRFFLPVRPRVNAIPPPDPANPDDPEAISLLPNPLEQVTGGQSLHALPVHRVYRPRRRINSRVVVVGGGASALALLEGLLLDPIYHFTSITVLAPQGLRPEPDAEVCGLCPVDDDFPPPRHFHALGLQAGVRVLQTMLLDIHRAQQAVVLPRGKVLNYDLLVLSSGLQDVASTRLAKLDYKEGKMELPLGVYPPSRPHLCKGLRDYVESAVERGEQVMVYGSSIDALTCIQGLLDRNVPAASITVALNGHPATKTHKLPPILAEAALDMVVFDVLTKHLRVKVEWGMELTGLVTGMLESTHDDGAPPCGPCVRGVQFIKSVRDEPAGGGEGEGEGEDEGEGVDDEEGETGEMGENLDDEAQILQGEEGAAPIAATAGREGGLEAQGEAVLEVGALAGTGDLSGMADTASDTQAGPPVRSFPVTVAVGALLLCDRRDVDPFLFRAVNDSGLVYDGRLVVDGGFRTADARVLAGGPLCKFTRSFRRGVYHDKHSSREVGLYLAEAVRDELAGVDPSERRPLPLLHRAKAQTAQLPGAMTYFHVHSPASPTPNNGDRDSVSLSTGFCNADLRLFGKFLTLRFSSLGRVQSVTYLGKEELRGRSYVPLVGLQDSYLRTARELHDLDRLDDWVAYLRDTWAGPLYHDSFVDLALSLRTLLRRDEGARAIVKNLLVAADDGKDDEVIVRTRKRMIGKGGAELNDDTRELVEKETITMINRFRGSLKQFSLSSEEEKEGMAPPSAS